MFVDAHIPPRTHESGDGAVPAEAPLSILDNFACPLLLIMWPESHSRYERLMYSAPPPYNKVPRRHFMNLNGVSLPVSTEPQHESVA